MQKRSRRIETEYQKEQRQYAWDLERDFDFGYYKELKSALEEAGLYCFYYNLVSRLSRSYNLITKTPLVKGELTFYAIYDDLRYYPAVRDMSDEEMLSQLQFLCDIGLLVRIEDNLYMLVDLAPSVEDKAIENLKNM